MNNQGEGLDIPVIEGCFRPTQERLREISERACCVIEVSTDEDLGVFYEVDLQEDRQRDDYD